MSEQPTNGTARSAVLPRLRAVVRLDGALDEAIVALEAEEEAAKAVYDAAKERYRLARQATADARTLRGLVTVAGGAPRGESDAATTGGKRWSRKFDACVSCGTTERKHAFSGYCTRCKNNAPSGAPRLEAVS